MITTTSSSKSKNYIFKKLNNRCTQLASMEAEGGQYEFHDQIWISL